MSLAGAILRRCKAACDHDFQVLPHQPVFNAAAECNASTSVSTSWTLRTEASSSPMMTSSSRLSELTSDEVYLKRAKNVFGAFGATLHRSGSSVPKLLAALDSYLDTPVKIAVVLPRDGPDDGAAAQAGTATAYVCMRGACERPTSEPEIRARLTVASAPALSRGASARLRRP